MKYDAVTLDTNIFDQKHLNLERGILAQFKQFAEGSARFVLSEIVLREVLRHLEADADLAKQHLEAAIRQSGLAQLFDEETLAFTSLLSSIAAGDRQDFKNALDQRLGREIAEIEPGIDAYSDDFYLSVVDFDVRLKDISLLTSADSFKIIQTQKDGFVAQMTVEITAQVNAEFNYFADAAHDRKIGESHESIATEFRADVLVSIRGDAVDDCTLADLELDDAPLEVDFGDIGPDYQGYEE